ncbi:MAG: TauD/TfdA family dioxygenase [Alphaproteobacteria bacterium]|nr:TauD/TfdA family dioxygenase [Alphaproteobacteria bacterium]
MDAIAKDMGAAAPAPTPDFDSYPIEHRIVHAEPIDRGVRVVWDDGLETRHHVFWLRESSADPETTHPVTREQALALIDIPADLRAEAVGTDESGGLWVRWSHGGHESRYHPGWLRTHAFETGETLATLPDRVTWDREIEERVPRFDGPAALEDESRFAEWLEAVHVYGVGILEGLPAEPEVIEQVPGRIGPIRTTNFGYLFDVQSKPDADSNAYTTMTLSTHVDLATREYQPGLQFLHCIENGAMGGDSVLADGFHLAGLLKEQTPEFYEVLTTVPLMHANKAKDTDYRWTAPMLVLDGEGNLDEVRWNPWLRAPLSAPLEQVDQIYRALQCAFALAEDRANQLRVRLQPGDLLGFDNRRVLHGRTAYDPTTGNRWLRGCYVEREELYSRLRIIARHARAQAER